MRELIVTDTIVESRDEDGNLLSSLDQAARILSGLPVIRETFTYVMNRYRGRTVKGIMAQLHADCCSFMKPIGTMDIQWVQP